MKNKIKIISILFILISFFIIGFDGSTYGELIDEVIVGEKRYIINLSASSRNFPDSFVEMYSEETLENMYISIFANYKDKDGNDFKLNANDYINYSCYEDSTCSMYYDGDVFKDYYDNYLWRFEDSELPNSFLYNNVEYTLDHYYVNYANMMQYKFGKPVISVDDKNVDADILYGTEKISVSDDLVDNVHFDWEFFMPTVKVTNNVVGSGVDPNKEFGFNS